MRDGLPMFVPGTVSCLAQRGAAGRLTELGLTLQAGRDGEHRSDFLVLFINSLV